MEAARALYPPPGVDLDRPSVARVCDWYLGGTANWAIDREFGKRVLAALPLVKPAALVHRRWGQRVVRHLARHGVRQFLDIGAGMPTIGSTHEVADEIAPDVRVVYVDREPVAAAHWTTFLEQHGDRARHAVVHADLRNPDLLWEQVAETGVINLAEPVALLLLAVLHIQQPGPGGDVGPCAVARLRELLAPGSCLAISHATDDGVPADRVRDMVTVRRLYEETGTPLIVRPRAGIAGLFGDFELLEPGLTWPPLWRPDDLGGPAALDVDHDFDDPAKSAMWAGVGHKPGRSTGVLAGQQAHLGEQTGRTTQGEVRWRGPACAA